MAYCARCDHQPQQNWRGGLVAITGEQRLKVSGSACRATIPNQRRRPQNSNTYSEVRLCTNTSSARATIQFPRE
jgi:hypothetical protein